MGQEGIKIYHSWNEADLSEDDKKDYTKIRDKFKAHFESKSNFRVERHLFRQVAQGANARHDDFIARLKTQAKKCKFSGDELEERIIEQIIEGTKHMKVRQMILKDESITLDKANNEA